MGSYPLLLANVRALLNSIWVGEHNSTSIKIVSAALIEPTTGMSRPLLEEDKEWGARQSADCDFRT